MGQIRKRNLTKIQIGEESLTDFNLQDIQMKNPMQVRTQKFNRHEEARNVQIGMVALFKKCGFGLRVQAKKLDLSDNIYPGVDKPIHTVGKLTYL